jgi:hypothetical protein
MGDYDRHDYHYVLTQERDVDIDEGDVDERDNLRMPTHSHKSVPKYFVFCIYDELMQYAKNHYVNILNRSSPQDLALFLSNYCRSFE